MFELAARIAQLRQQAIQGGLGTLPFEYFATLLLDAVSSFGAEFIDAPGWHIGAMAATANKCLHGVPGIAFVVASEAAWAAPAPAPSSVYLDLHNYLENQHGSGFSPFTQAVQPAFALDVALDELAEQGGWQARRARYRHCMAAIAKSLDDLGVATLIEPADMSCVLGSWRLPEAKGYAELHDALKNQGFVIYAGQGNLSTEIFRLSFMGDIRDPDVTALAGHLSALLGPATD